MKYGKDDYMCFKVSREDDDPEATSLSYDKMFKLSVKVSINNDKLEKRIFNFK